MDVLSQKLVINVKIKNVNMYQSAVISQSTQNYALKIENIHSKGYVSTVKKINKRIIVLSSGI